MTAIFEFPISSETLTPEEVAQITGCVTSKQVDVVDRIWRKHFA